MSLAEIQRALADVFRAATPVTASAERVVLAEEVASGNERLSPVMQFEIYREQFFLRHVDVLGEDFRSLAYVLGDDGFGALTTAYLRAFPPCSFSLRDLGKDLARFVGRAHPWADDALLSDLARVEWAFVEAFDAPAGPALALEDVTLVPEDAWPSARIVLQPPLRRLALRHAALDYRLAIRRGEAVTSRPEARASFAAVFRRSGALECIDLDAEAYALLEALAEGTALGEACERVASACGATEDAFQARVGAWFQQWTALGIIGRIELAP